MGLFRRDKDLDTRDQLKQKSIMYHQVFGTLSGKQVLYDLMDGSLVLSSKELSAFEQGRRSVVLDILHLINVKPEQFNKILEGEE